MSLIPPPDQTRPVRIRGARDAAGEPVDLCAVAGRWVDPADAPADAEVVEADGLLALPGLVDIHVHLREPGREDAETIETGTRAAAAGGFTAVCAMANTQPVTDNAEIAEFVARTGREVGSCFVQPIGAVSKGLEGAELAELGLMHRSEAAVTMFSDDGRCVNDSRLMRRALEYVRAFGGVVAQHAQDAGLAGTGACCHEGPVSGRLGLGGWPSVAESAIVARDVQLARTTGSRLHVCHVSTAEALDVIRWAKARDIDVTCEVTPHHLMLTVDEVVGYDPTYKVNPPLRPTEDALALREGLADGTVDAVATDHAPHARHDKEHAFADAAFGMLGLETSLGVVIETIVSEGRLDWSGVVDRMASAPARIARLADQGRPLRVGEPANLCLADPERRAVVDRAASRSKSRNNPWHGRLLPDPVTMTMWRGAITHRRPRP